METPRIFVTAPDGARVQISTEVDDGRSKGSTPAALDDGAHGAPPDMPIDFARLSPHWQARSTRVRQGRRPGSPPGVLDSPNVPGSHDNPETRYDKKCRDVITRYREELDAQALLRRKDLDFSLVRLANTIEDGQHDGTTETRRDGCPHDRPDREAVDEEDLRLSLELAHTRARFVLQAGYVHELGQLQGDFGKRFPLAQLPVTNPDDDWLGSFVKGAGLCCMAYMLIDSLLFTAERLSRPGPIWLFLRYDLLVPAVSTMLVVRLLRCAVGISLAYYDTHAVCPKRDWLLGMSVVGALVALGLPWRGATNRFAGVWLPGVAVWYMFVADVPRKMRVLLRGPLPHLGELRRRKRALEGGGVIARPVNDA